MSQDQSSNKRIAKNTLMLYIRMLLSMLVGLYTSRVVLQTLGVEDYGIYGVVGGVVSMMGFLNSSMSGATSRFLTVAIGKGEEENTAKIFSSALIVHICIALIVLFVSETIGLWFFYNKLVIPESRMSAAFWVYQGSIFSAILSITQVPYNASIIAHEKMDVYAYVELLNVFLKLGIVYLLLFLPFDKLLIYAGLVLLVSFIVLMTYRVYCLTHFTECRFRWVKDKSIFRSLMSFSGLDLFGNICVTFRNQGTTLLLNMFFGPIVNAGANIANVIIGTVSSLSGNVTTAFRPPIMKQYAVGNIEAMTTMMNRSLSLTSLLLSLMAFPILAEMEYVLFLWLGEIPPYAVTISKLAVFNCLVGGINGVILAPIHATGDIKALSIWGGSLYLLNLVIDYICLRFFHIDPYTVFFLNVVMKTVILFYDIALLKKLIPAINYIRLMFFKVSPILIISIVAYIASQMLDVTSNQNEIVRLLAKSFVLLPLIIGSYYFLIFDKEDRLFLIRTCKSFYCRLCKKN